MKKSLFFIGLCVLLLGSISLLFTQKSTTIAQKEQSLKKKKKSKTLEDRQQTANQRWQYEFDLLKNPITGKIPDGIHQQELRATQRVPDFNEEYNSQSRNNGSITITPRGPNNLGGRTRAIAFDVRNANIIVAGSVSSGIYRSINGGTSWTNVTPTGAIHNVTAIAQDPRSGHEDTWYYGTGESLGNSAKLANASNALYLGFGIYKSTDNGASWTALSSTQSNLEVFNTRFDFVSRIVVDPTNGDVYAATCDVISRSTDGGTIWSAALGSLTNNNYTDIVVSSTGRLYASFDGRDGSEGVHTSTDGTSWTQIAGGGVGTTPAGWNAGGTYGRIVLAIAPSDEDKVYAMYWNGTVSSCAGTPAPEADLFRWSQAGNAWTDLSANLPDEGGCIDGNDPFAVQGGYDMVIAVKPNDANTVFVGGVNAYRSTDGFTTTGNTTRIGGYVSTSSYTKYANHHADIHIFAFAPGDNDNLYTGTDGGIHKSDITAGTPVWTSLNNDYVSYQYFYVDLEPSNASTVMAGGAQDNGMTESGSGTSHNEILGGDGCATGIISYTSATNFNIISSLQNGALFRLTAASNGFVIRPAGTNSSDFVTYFHLDQDNTGILYYVDGTNLYRTRIANVISGTTVTGNPATGWEEMTGVAGALGGFKIRSLATSRNDAFGDAAYSASDANRRLYIGTSDGKVYRLDDPAFVTESTAPTAITPTGGTATSGSIISGLSVNPEDDKELLVVYSNYGSSNVHHTSNADNASPTWSAIEGSSSAAVGLASIRSCMIAAKGTEKLYFVGTTTGLYCTNTLNGSSTAWSSVGSGSLGLAITSSMRFRPVDSKLAVGTHGNGMFLLDLSTILPVELTSFEGVPSNDKVNLTWSTASEQNNDYFEVQHSTDGKTFERIGIVAGNGTTSNTSNYEFTHDKPLGGSNYYRLSQVDFDGEAEFSKVIEVEMMELETSGRFSIYPNPFKSTINITTSSAAIDKEVSITLYDLKGQTYSLYNDVLRENQLQLSTAHLSLAPGIYFVKIKGISGKEQVIKLLKQ